MEYHEAVNFLFDLRRFQVKPGTESIQRLLSHLGDPHEGVSFVQVAGSNGKGSTARMLDSTLREAGQSVGLYTSPHFDNVRERVRVDGRKIPESALSAFVAEAKPYLVERAADGEPLTFFETVTALAIWYFDQADVDVAVLEVGMGGELDATSAVDPVASAVTNVSLEHTAVLGDTIEEIARTKAAVAPADNPLVTGAAGDALDVIREEVGDVLTVGGADADTDVRTAYGGRVNHQEAAVTVETDDETLDLRIPLLGAYQARNAGIAVALSRQVRPDISDDEIHRGLRNAHWPGRFEVMGTDPMVVLDGAHNPDACAQVATVLDEFEYDDLHLVYGAMHDKDHGEMVEALPDVASVVTCHADISRAEDPEILASVFERIDVPEVETGDVVASALERARERADPDDCVLVVGSLYVVAEARTTWTRAIIPKTHRTLDDARETLERANVADEGSRDERAAKAVHQTVHTRVQRRQARHLREELFSIGGDCAVSGHESGGELVDVVLMGTLDQFDRLTENLRDRPYALPELADEIEASLGRDPSAETHGYPWEDGPSVMGILNVTPDSFHDGGEFYDIEDAVEQAEAMVEAGVGIIDVGGESTRPGAEEVPVDEEIRRVTPVIEALSDLDALVSVDTRKAAVAEAALDAGADILNDVTGLEDPEMRFLAAERDVPVIVMHSIDAPVIPDKDIDYDDVVEDVIDELTERVLLAEKAGIPRRNIIVDPGLGFGKSKAENFELLGRVDEFRALGCPVLIGHSHKSMFSLVGEKTGDNLAATIAGTAIAADRGADIIRVHDVPENVAAVNVALASQDSSRFTDE
ncbi:dihydropteroate synthase [Haloferax mediterranei ATCC 33500]|uniref:Probable bifunctional folylpolyglutamate synthase/dihydropteroate synthase n=1 Tax=Haloferax mediterranei (strain ATCC 33500 / DSM 1411 / JCM 8866 / NBRC 14739 / NCIMB 2177 / R-4) TaxID=523841 RepID=I3R3K1_HALMT|nr:dihydropteroate synthase [Haloferax mediterranei]AFK18811.1 dihydropteroate synthase [Haloferax mediterranei ATCC 33500]AHZ21822.1 dihydropteroate synthase [Haloferax mediterranei ATCC 33500]EMA03331.1 dihydropteroate synthase [Haloferax mediterranei ATCC 33500]MDX5988904.1 dihydropteroate synthase [Haloferax mediterranei ATCC 33500]QCQ75302.1 dihydropteroate synthase [Haloferax mediterranei ATCC 33500]